MTHHRIPKRLEEPGDGLHLFAHRLDDGAELIDQPKLHAFPCLFDPADHFREKRFEDVDHHHANGHHSLAEIAPHRRPIALQERGEGVEDVCRQIEGARDRVDEAVK